MGGGGPGAHICAPTRKGANERGEFLKQTNSGARRPHQPASQVELGQRAPGPVWRNYPWPSAGRSCGRHSGRPDRKRAGARQFRQNETQSGRARAFERLDDDDDDDVWPPSDWVGVGGARDLKRRRGRVFVFLGARRQELGARARLAAGRKFFSKCKFSSRKRAPAGSSSAAGAQYGRARPT